MKRKLRVYVSGPLTTKGNSLVHARKALDAAEKLFRAGYIPIVPHLIVFWDFVYPHTWEEAMELCLEMLQDCDVLLRIPGKSRGARAEVRLANKLGKPVFRTMAALQKRFPTTELKILRYTTAHTIQATTSGYFDCRQTSSRERLNSHENR